MIRSMTQFDDVLLPSVSESPADADKDVSTAREVRWDAALRQLTVGSRVITVAKHPQSVRTVGDSTVTVIGTESPKSTPVYETFRGALGLAIRTALGVG